MRNYIYSIPLFNKLYTLPKRRKCILLILGVLLAIFISNISYADTISSDITVTLQRNSYSNSLSDIIFTPKVNKEYNFNIKITNLSNNMRRVKYFISRGISKESHIDYSIDSKENLLNSYYDILKYTRIESNNQKSPFSIDLSAKESRIIHVKIIVPRIFQGEMLGGINFTELLSETANNKVKTSQVYQKVIVVRLLGKKVKEVSTQYYKEFKFVNTNSSLMLKYYNYNNNSKLIYADKGSYTILNPKQEIIGEGKLNSKSILTPYTKTQMKVPLNNKLSLTKGQYTFITYINNHVTKYYFTYNTNYINKIVSNFAQGRNIKENKFVYFLLTLVISLLLVMVIDLYKKY